MYYSYGISASPWQVVAAVFLAITATVLAFIFIVPEKRRARLNSFGKFLHDTCNFKYLIVEKILQALYIFLTCFVLLCGFFMLFRVNYWGEWQGLYGILIMVIGPIAIRLVYELAMMLVLLVKNVISINNKLSGKSGDPFAAPDVSAMGRSPVYGSAAPSESRVHGFTVPDMSGAGAPDAAPGAAKFCTVCGSKLDENGHCPTCGSGDPS